MNDKNELMNNYIINLYNSYKTLYDSEALLSTQDFIENQLNKKLIIQSKDYQYSKSEVYKLLFKNSYKEYLDFIKYRISIENDNYKTIIKNLYKILFTLNSINDTDMSRDISFCITNGRVENIPFIINKKMRSKRLEMSDIAFLKVTGVISVFDKELKIPKGLRSSLIELNIETAIDVKENRNIYYDMYDHRFVSRTKIADSIGLDNRVLNAIINNNVLSESSTANSSELNVISSGTEVLNKVGEEELFAETELMDFCTFLSNSPMVGLRNNTGRKIYQLIENLYRNDENSISFDRNQYYHCRSHRIGDMPFTFEEMLQAPHGIPWAGRFNHVGRSCYYFSDTRYGAETEVKRHLKREEELQTVVIHPVCDAKLLDLSDTLNRGKRFLKYIRYRVPDNDTNKMPKQYLIPCFVADCCKDVGFKGIKYYGAKEYMNYVCWRDGYFEFVEMLEP